MSYLRKVEQWKPIHRRLNQREAWRRVRAARVKLTPVVTKVYAMMGSSCTNCGKNLTMEAMESRGFIGKILKAVKGTFIGVTPHTNLTCRGVAATPSSKQLGK